MLFIRPVRAASRTFSRRLNKFAARRLCAQKRSENCFWLPLTLVNKPLMPLQYKVPCRTNLLRAAAAAAGLHKLSALPRFPITATFSIKSKSETKNLNKTKLAPLGGSRFIRPRHPFALSANLPTPALAY